MLAATRETVLEDTWGAQGRHQTSSFEAVWASSRQVTRCTKPDVVSAAAGGGGGGGGGWVGGGGGGRGKAGTGSSTPTKGADMPWHTSRW